MPFILQDRVRNVAPYVCDQCGTESGKSGKCNCGGDLRERHPRELDRLAIKSMKDVKAPAPAIPHRCLKISCGGETIAAGHEPACPVCGGPMVSQH